MVQRAGQPDDRRAWVVVILAAVVAAAVVRLWGLGAAGMTHPEVYIPGIPLPPGITEPPPRLTFLDALRWHVHAEPHPVGYYLAMFGWTSAFGVTPFALRLPAAILGTGSVLLIGLLGWRIWGPVAGGLTAVLLALHGFHAFWSEAARTYVPATFLILLGTGFLLRIVGPDRRPLAEPGYVLSMAAAVNTTELSWVVLAVHIAWPALVLQRDPAALARPLTRTRLWQGLRLSQLQGLVIALGAPEFAHALYTARRNALESLPGPFLIEYLGFGFLYPENPFAVPSLVAPFGVTAVAIALTLVLCAAGMRAPVALAPRLADRPVPGWLRIGVALVAAAVVLALAGLAKYRNGPIAVTALLPLLALAVPACVLIVARVLSGIPGLRRVEPMAGLALIWGLLAPLALVAAALVAVSVLAERAFLVFLPGLLLLAAAGLSVLVPRRLLPVGAALVAAPFAGSVVFNRMGPNSPRDYQALAAAMAAEMRPGDLILLRKRDWADTPLLYYLPADGVVVTDWTAAAAASAGRVWIVTWPDPRYTFPEDGRRDAVAGWTRAGEITRTP
jgi:hypothetical protein